MRIVRTIREPPDKIVDVRYCNQTPFRGDCYKVRLAEGVLPARILPMALANTSPHPLMDRVNAVLEQIRPAVKADGGDVELIDIVDGTAQVRFHGACVGCPSSNLTLHMGIERAVVAQVPEIKKVVAVA